MADATARHVRTKEQIFNPVMGYGNDPVHQSRRRQASGSKHYFTGKPCKYGHVSERAGFQQGFRRMQPGAEPPMVRSQSCEAARICAPAARSQSRI